MPDAIAFWQAAGPGFVGTLFFALGLAVGSFSNVVVFRIPLGWSLTSPGSTCPACTHPLHSGDLVPVASYVWLRGRCRYCGVSISPWYPLMELASGITAAGAGASRGWAAGFCALGTWLLGSVLLAVLLVYNLHSARRE